MTYDPRRPAGSRLLQVEVGGKPLREDATYTVAVIDYLVRGGDGFTAFKGAKVLVNEESGPQLSDVVLEGIAAKGVIAPQVDGRIRSVQD
jgi:2',3'-cyclic-nucleotide 2'-phosphodiesterase (5'-nucleotidase family)